MALILPSPFWGLMERDPLDASRDFWALSALGTDQPVAMVATADNLCLVGFQGTRSQVYNCETAAKCVFPRGACKLDVPLHCLGDKGRVARGAKEQAVRERRADSKTYAHHNSTTQHQATRKGAQSRAAFPHSPARRLRASGKVL